VGARSDAAAHAGVGLGFVRVCAVAWRGLGGLLCLSVYVTAPAFLVFGPLVHTDIAVTLFSLITLWRFAEVWREPSRKNSVLFGLGFAGALLSKFTAGILLFAFVAFALSTRWRAVPGQPTHKAELRAWRRLRWRSRGRAFFGRLLRCMWFISCCRCVNRRMRLIGSGMCGLGAAAAVAHAYVVVCARGVTGFNHREPADVCAGSYLSARRVVLLPDCFCAEVCCRISGIAGAGGWHGVATEAGR